MLKYIVIMTNYPSLYCWIYRLE